MRKFSISKPNTNTIMFGSIAAKFLATLEIPQ